MIAISKQAPHFPSTKGMRFPVEVPTRGEVMAMLAKCSRRAPTGIRNRAMLTVLYRCGLRIAELLALMPKDVDLTANTLTVLMGKGSKRRVLGLDDGAVAVLQLWLDRRKALGFTGRHRLFTTLQGKPVSGTYVRRFLKRTAVKIDYQKRLHPHAFRHAFASELREEGTDIGVICDLLGHSSIATTSRYVQHLRPMASLEAIAARPAWEV